MKHLYIALLVILPFISWANEPTQMTQFYDSHMESEFEEMLLESNIPFRKIGHQFHYRVSNDDKVQAIGSEILSRLKPGYSFVFTKDERFLKVKEAFERAGLRFIIVERDEGTGVSWNEDENKRARKIIRQVTGIPL